ncbi:glycosyltransferase family 4 protein [Cycloclasticus pugetii]|uniref:glycosyltransferase family 4 protein n=1 Tax=Cycloclasticus pugetii TaxID=34068 RepID=UPI003A94D67B
MKIAIVHEWFVTPGGAEKVVKAMLELFPEADVFSVVDFFNDTQRNEYLNGKKTKNSFIQKLPLAKKHYRNYLPLMPLAIEQIDVSEYDVVISSSHAVAKGVITSPNQLHICYCYSPIRYAWDLKFQYLDESNLKHGVKSLIARYLLHKIKTWDFISSQNVDHYIAISHFIQSRIQKFYRRESTVIYPNVDIERFTVTEKKEEFYFTASRLVPYKKIALIAKAFKEMPDKKLIIIGDGPEKKKVEEIASSSTNIEYLGYQSNEVLKEHMEKAKAFLFAAEEDFGIVALEAQACGTPVIAYGKGGALDTVRHGETGYYFQEQTVDSIKEAVVSFEGSKDNLLSAKEIRFHAERFSEDIFKNSLKEFIQEKYQIHQSSN